MIGQRDADDRMKQPRYTYHKLANKNGDHEGENWVWVHFYTILNHGELRLNSVSCLHKLETKNYA